MVKLQILYQTYRPTQDLILDALLHSMNLYKITSVSNGWVSIQTRHVYNMIPLYQFSMIYCFMLYVQAWQVSLVYHASNSSSPAPTTPSRPPLPLGTLYIQCEWGTQKKKLPPPPNPSIRPPLVHFSVHMGGVSRRDIANKYDIISVHYSEQSLH